MASFQLPNFQFSAGLTDEQRQFFQTHGVIQFKNFIDRDTVAQLLGEIERVERGLIQRGVQKVNGIPLKYGSDHRGRTLIQRLAFTSQFSDVLSDFLKDSRFQVLTELLGPYAGRVGEAEKDGLVVNHYVNSATSEFKDLGWHTDSPRDLFLGSRIMPMLNVGLHLDDCPRSNGGLRVLAGTHTQGYLGLFFKKKYYIDNTADPNEVGFDIEAGDLTVHDGRIWHRVEPSPFVGERSRRRVMYIPIVTGSYQPKHADSPTPFYHKLGAIKFKPLKAWSWSGLRPRLAALSWIRANG